MFLCCWRICLVCLALELVGPCVVLGFSVGMEAFDELLSINVPWSQDLDLSLLLPVIGLIFIASPMVTTHRGKAAQMPASAISKRGLGREAQHGLHRLK